MATRFFLEAPATVPVAPAFSAEWEYTAEFNRLKLTQSLHIAGEGIWFQVTDATATSDRDALMVQFVSDPLRRAGTLSGTMKGQARVRENLATTNLRAQIIIRVFDNDGAVERGVAYPGDLATLTGDPPSEWDTAFQNRQLPRGGPVALTNVDYQVGDRLVVEVGYRKHAALSTQGRLEPLPVGATAFLPEDETETGAFWGWIEFSQDLPLTGGGHTGLRSPIGSGLRQRRLRQM